MGVELLQAQADECRVNLARVRGEVRKIIVGQERVVECTITAILCGGNVLLEGVPGLGKTELVKALARTLDLDFKRYVILGACNPQFAHQALTGEPLLGVLLPCNVVVMDREGGGVIVAAFKPTAGFSLVDNPEVAPIAELVEGKMRRVLDRLG